MAAIDTEKKRLKELAAAGDGYGGIFAQEFPGEGSGWQAYAPQPGGPFRVYDSSELCEVEQRLQAVWKDVPGGEQRIPVLLAAVRKTQGETARRVTPVDLYNYMM